MKTTKLIKENEQDIVEVTIPQDAVIRRYERFELEQMITEKQNFIDALQGELDELKGYQKLFK